MLTKLFTKVEIGEPGIRRQNSQTVWGYGVNVLDDTSYPARCFRRLATITNCAMLSKQTTVSNTYLISFSFHIIM